MSDDKGRSDDLSPMQRAALAVRTLRAKVEDIESRRREPIAIVGLACRLPGGVEDPESYWRLLREGRDAISEVPPERWNIDDYYDPTPSTPGKMYIREGGFVGAVDGFDSEFFGISPREATSLDPQHRMLLEVSWEALENAGQNPFRLKGTQTGVFVGLSSSDYPQAILKSRPVDEIDLYFASGSPLGAAAGRISYFLGLQGPTIALDTACSSSLVAAHLACQSLRNGECDQALVGGINLMLSPEIVVIICQARMLSPSGRSKTFDASADGYGRGEGCGVVVLKRLSDALRDRDNVMAVISGSAINHDGPSSGFTVPYGPAQETVIRQALEAAGVDPAEIDYIEAHGTGTSLGDPIEVGALGRVFGDRGPEGEDLIVGSVKTNIGHLEAAAGISGLIKIVLSLQHGEIPAHLHFDEPNPHIPWDRLPLKVPTEKLPWERGRRVRRAGVSSFGVNGTVAHIVVSEAPVRPADSRVEDGPPRDLLILSARSNSALEAQVRLYRRHLETHPEQELADICYTAAVGRAHFPYRLATTAGTTSEMAEGLASIVNEKMALTAAAADTQAKVVFLFSGQGAQYPGMGRELYETESTFRETMDLCDELLRPHLPSPLLAALYPEDGNGDDSLLHQTAYTQPALFALEYSLARMWRAWGVEPAAVLGHSIGEYVAACVAGVFSLEEGLRLIAGRGRLMQALPQVGAMAAVFAEREVVEEAVAGEPLVSVAAVNGPENVAVSGDRAAVERVAEELAERGVRSKALRVSHAFHSPLMESILDDFERLASQASFERPRIDLVSNVTGELAADELCEPKYWREHVRLPVQFEGSMRTMLDRGYRIFVELGPSTTLLSMGRQCLTDPAIAWAAALRRNRGDWQQVLDCAGDLYVRGVDLDWLAFYQPYSRSRVVLSTYPFERQRYWVDTPDRHSRRSLGVDIPTGQEEVQKLSEKLRQSGRLGEDEIESLPRILEALAAQAAEDEWTDGTDLFYELRWEEKELIREKASDEPLPERDRCLVFADEGGLAHVLQQRFERRGVDCVLVHPGEAFAERSDGSFELNPALSGDFDTLVSRTMMPDGDGWLGAVHLWSLDATEASASSAASLEEDQTSGCASALHLTQALSRSDIAEPFPVWYVTRGAQPVDTEGTFSGLSQTPLWGLGRVISLEHPELWGGLLDLDPRLEQRESVSRIVEESLGGDGEDQVAYRGNQRWVIRLVRSTHTVERFAAAREDGTYLVTGGLGGLGIRVARRLVERGARNLVLLGRSGAATESARQTVELLKQSGAAVWVAQGDVADVREMTQVFDRIDKAMPPLRGVIHAAGVATFRRIRDLDAESLAATLRPKVTGSWVLHELTRDLDLDFFVCFSSIAGVWGSGGHAHYAAANHFMDALAHYRQTLGLAGTGLSWGPWEGGGMAKEETRSWLQRSGVEALPPKMAMRILEALLQTDRPHLAVAQVRWQDFQELYEARGRRPLLDRVRVTTSGRAPGARAESLLAELEESPGRRVEILLDHLRQETARILGHRDAQTLDADRPLLDQGLDSLTAVEIRNLIAAVVGVTLPLALLLEGVSLQQLAVEVENGLSLTDSPESRADRVADQIRPEEAQELLQNLDELSDDEVASLLGTVAEKETGPG